MPDVARENIKPGEPPCERCGGHLRLLTILPRASDHPAFRIFGCETCSFIRWVADTLGTT
jgi:hypothetical protein